MTHVPVRWKWVAAATFGVMLAACSNTGPKTAMGTDPSAPTAVPTSTQHLLEKVSAAAISLPSGGVAFTKPDAEPRAEVWVAALGLAHLVGAEQGTTLPSLDDIVARTDLGGLRAALPTLLVAKAAGNALSAVSVDRLKESISGMDEPQRTLLQLRSNSILGDFSSGNTSGTPSAAVCSGALEALGTGQIEFNVQATVALASAVPGPCDIASGEFAERWCANPPNFDLSTTDELLDLLAVAPSAAPHIDDCAVDSLAALLASPASESWDAAQSLLQSLATVAWASGERTDRPLSEFAEHPLVKQAFRVLRDEGRSDFPLDSLEISFEDYVIAAALHANGLLDVRLAELKVTGGPHSVDVQHLSSGTKCETSKNVRMPIEVAAGNPAENVDWLAAQVPTCAAPIVSTRSGDPAPQLLALLGAVVVGCDRGAQGGGLAGANEDVRMPADYYLAGEPLLQYLEALSDVPIEQRCVFSGLRTQ